MQLFDSHAHLIFEKYTCSPETLIEEARKNSVCKIINISTDPATLQKALFLSKNYPGIYHAASTHPQDATIEDPFFFQIEELAKKKILVAIGETGLDYHWNPHTKEIQKTVFLKYVNLAKKMQLPLIIHCREAYEDFYLLEKEHFSTYKDIVLHCFSGNLTDALKACERGWYISISGVITYPNAKLLCEIVKRIPLKHLLIETDSPYLAPQKYRGGINTPAYLVEVAKKIAEIKNITIEEVAAQTFENACMLFNIQKIIDKQTSP